MIATDAFLVRTTLGRFADIELEQRFQNAIALGSGISFQRVTADSHRRRH
jgi:hypothetical protein